MNTYPVSAVLQFEFPYQSPRQRGLFTIRFGEQGIEGELPESARQVLVNGLMGLLSHDTLHGTLEVEHAREGDDGPDVPAQRGRSGQCRKFRFTQRSIAALPCHPRGGGANQTEYRDTVAAGLCLSVGRSGLKHFHFWYSLRGKKRSLSLGDVPTVTLKEARQRVNEWRMLLSLGIDPGGEPPESEATPTLAEFTTHSYLPFARVHKRSWREDEAKLRNRILPRFGALRLDKITVEDLQRFYNELAKALTPATANRYMALIGRMFNLAVRWEVCSGNPVKMVEKVTERNARERHLSCEELARFLRALDETSNRTAAAVLKFLLFTGLRKSEALRISWNNVDRSDATVLLPHTKGGQPRTVILNALAAGVLDAMWNHSGPHSPWVFPGRDVQRPLAALHRVFKDVCARAGIKNLRIHDLRHSFASIAISGGASLYEVQQLLGHASSRMTQRYAHLESTAVRRATECVARQISGLSAPA